MSTILHIDTALDNASVCLSQEDAILGLRENPSQSDHAAWLHGAIAGLLENAKLPLRSLNAVSVTIGPGSYTGLRVGLAAAKGICYALRVPLVTCNTLEVMALSVREEATDLVIPLIDARRMEVFTAMYNRKLEELIPPHNLVLHPGCFGEALAGRAVLYCGNGAAKWRPYATAPEARFSDTRHNATHLAVLAMARFRENRFADLAYTEPLYIKEFYTPAAH